MGTGEVENMKEGLATATRVATAAAVEAVAVEVAEEEEGDEENITKMQMTMITLEVSCMT